MGHPIFLRGASNLSDHSRLCPFGFRLFSLLFRGPFQLSFTLLVHYRSWLVFRVGSYCLPVHARYPTHATSESQLDTFQFTPTRLSLSMAYLFRQIRLRWRDGSRVHNTTFPPGHPWQVRFTLIPFRSPLIRESLLISFPAGTEMFHFPAFPIP